MSEYPVKTLMERYCFYRQKYVFMKKDFIRFMDKPYTKKQVWEHLNGNMTMCVFAGPNNTKFLSIDVDMREGDVVHKVIDTMDELGIPREKIYVSDSGGKGYHVDIFFSNGIFNWKAKELYELIIYFSGLNRRKVEYRPTATQSIKLPLGIHRTTERRCWFVDRETLEPIEDFYYIEQTETIDPALIDDVIAAGNKKRFYILLAEVKDEPFAKKSNNASPRKRIGGDDIRIEEEGTRQQCMISEALRLFRCGCDRDGIRDGLKNWLAVQDPQLYKDPQEECMRNIDNISSWVMKHGRRSKLNGAPPEEMRYKARIYESDAKRIASAPTRAARMLAFLITVFCDQYGFCGMGFKKLADMVEMCGEKTIHRAVTKFRKMNLFEVSSGGYKNMGNMLRKVTNKYRFPDDYERTGEYVELNTLVNAKNIYDMYISVSAALCSDDDIAHMTANERRDIRRAREERNAS